MEKNHLVEDDQLIDLTTFKQEVLKDYEICLTSREVSFQGRKEVLGGKAKFGIFGSGIELPQVVMAKFFKKGDWKSGYYRDQTFAFALELSSLESYFAQLYADSKNDPFSGGRQMNAHFATRNIDDEGNIINLVEQYNIAADLAPTAGQVTHALGLALASKCFKNSWDCDFFEHLSDQGQEVCFCTIGDASTSEGQFWETVNAAGVLKIPLAIFVWDNGYGISVPIELQTVKASISEALKGMGYYNNIINEHETGILIYKIKGWDYSDLCQQIAEGIHLVRTKGVPAIFHIEELTQPHGHSTSGSQERYKSKERLDWEKNWDCILKMEEWILANKIAEPHEIDTLKQLVKNKVMEAKNTAWVNYQNTFKHTIDDIIGCFNNLQFKTDFNFEIAQNLLKEIIEHNNYSRSFILHKLSLIIDLEPDNTLLKPLIDFRNNYNKMGFDSYNKNLYYEGNKDKTISHFEASELTYNNPKIQLKNGYEILNIYFKELFPSNPYIFAFGEDVGYLGDVNQGMLGLQNIFGSNRIFDTGIREQSIVGQAMGMALRGLRPIAEIQYLDYLVYALQTLCDDVSTLHYRTNGIQICPLIIRTRGHRLEGIWHSGSPMGMLVNSLPGIRLCVPRNMIQAVGMYNTLLKGNDPGIVIECLNGYRIKEKLPDQNLIDYFISLGEPEVLIEGDDITIVSYGSVLRIIERAIQRISKRQISCELIDVQTLNPFDVRAKISKSVKKTNRLLIVDEDVPSGISAYILKHIMEDQNCYKYLDAKPRCLSGTEHRPAYGDDGDYFSKPNEESIMEAIIEIMAE